MTAFLAYTPRNLISSRFTGRSLDLQQVRLSERLLPADPDKALAISAAKHGVSPSEEARAIHGTCGNAGKGNKARLLAVWLRMRREGYFPTPITEVM